MCPVCVLVAGAVSTAGLATYNYFKSTSVPVPAKGTFSMVRDVFSTGRHVALK